MRLTLLIFLAACADKDQADDTGKVVAECLDPRPSYAGCVADGVFVDTTTGNTTASSVRTYDADGNLVGEERDNGADGTVDYVTSTTYDADGNPLTVSVDVEGDGVWNTIITHVYNGDGDISTTSMDLNGDGSPESTSTYTYADGVLTSITTDNNGDGTPDTSCTITTVAEGDGEKVTASCASADGAHSNEVVTMMDGKGEPISRTTDQDGDGIVDVTELFTRDPATCLLETAQTTSTRIQEEVSVTRVETTTLTYDDDDRVVESAIHAVSTSSEGELVQDSATTYTYTCQ